MNERDVKALTQQYVEPGTTIFADEHPCYAALAVHYPVRHVNHQDQYSADDGTNQNQAESFFSVMRRTMIGQIHKCAPKNLALYVNEIVWRQDRRRIGSTGLFKELLGRCLRAPPSRDFSKYWQGNLPLGDGMWVTQ